MFILLIIIIIIIIAFITMLTNAIVNNKLPHRTATV